MVDTDGVGILSRLQLLQHSGDLASYNLQVAGEGGPVHCKETATSAENMGS